MQITVIIVNISQFSFKFMYSLYFINTMVYVFYLYIMSMYEYYIFNNKLLIMNDTFNTLFPLIRS